jgi:hypothetical protein
MDVIGMSPPDPGNGPASRVVVLLGMGVIDRRSPNPGMIGMSNAFKKVIVLEPRPTRKWSVSRVIGLLGVRTIDRARRQASPADVFSNSRTRG